MELNKAIFSISSKKPDFFVSAFYHKLVFGPTFGNPQVFKIRECFEFDYSNYHKIYIGLFPIAKFLSGKSHVDHGDLLKRDDISYKWKISENKEIIFYIRGTEEDVNEFSIKFSDLEFNDLIYLLSELCFLTLNLHFDDLTLFINLSKFLLNLINFH